jgi:hypothetical protein
MLVTTALARHVPASVTVSFPWRQRLLAFVVLLIFSFLTGCFELEQTIRIRPDGSGTIEERRITFDAAHAVQDQFIRKHFPLPNSKPTGDSSRFAKDLAEFQVSDDFHKLKAAEFGNEVRFVSAEPISTERGSGYRATYSFDHISKIKLPVGDSVGTKQPEPISFEFDRQRPGELVVLIPLRDMLERFAQSSMGEGKASEPFDKDFRQALESALKGAKSRCVLIPEGKITSTDASHREGGVIILSESEWDKIADNRPLIDFLFDRKPKTIEQAYVFYSRAPGQRYELKPRVTVKWE